MIFTSFVKLIRRLSAVRWRCAMGRSRRLFACITLILMTAIMNALVLVGRFLATCSASAWSIEGRASLVQWRLLDLIFYFLERATRPLIHRIATLASFAMRRMFLRSITALLVSRKLVI